MATALKQLTITLGLLASDPSALGAKLGLGDYMWSVRQIGQCGANRNTQCLLLSSKWDWKRPQAYSIFLMPSKSPWALNLRVNLENQDRSDNDIVCLVLIAVSEDGSRAGGVFLSYEVLSQHSLQDDVTLPIAKNLQAVRLEIGSKQCDETHAQDEKAARRVLTAR